MRPETEARLKLIVAKLPELRVGDEWVDVPNLGALIVIERLAVEDGMHWPMTIFRVLAGAPAQALDPRMGAPMYLFGRLVKRGAGAGWRPKA